MSPITLTFLENQAALKRFLGRMLPVAADVEDAAQEVFLRAHVASSTETVVAPKAFLFRIARNLAINERARMWHTSTTLIGDSYDLQGLGADDFVSSEDRWDSDRKMLLFSEAVADLPAKCQQVFVLRKLYDASHKEIAEKMGVSVSTVEKHIATGLARCTEYLSERGYGVGESSAKRRLSSQTRGAPKKALAPKPRSEPLPQPRRASGRRPYPSRSTSPWSGRKWRAASPRSNENRTCGSAS
jgi:RNA polymerase sigma-70 factor (ECF subfamily)